MNGQIPTESLEHWVIIIAAGITAIATVGVQVVRLIWPQKRDKQEQVKDEAAGAEQLGDAYGELLDRLKAELKEAVIKIELLEKKVMTTETEVQKLRLVSLDQAVTIQRQATTIADLSYQLELEKGNRMMVERENETLRKRVLIIENHGVLSAGSKSDTEPKSTVPGDTPDNNSTLNTTTE